MVVAAVVHRPAGAIQQVELVDALAPQRLGIVVEEGDELFSDYRGEIKAGTYELSTAMTAQEMIRVMCGVDEEAEEE